MEPRKKKKIIRIVLAVVLVAVIATASIVFVVQTSKKNDNKITTEIENTSTTITNRYNSAIAKGEIPANYAGNYIYSGLVCISFVFNDTTNNVTYSDYEINQYIQILCKNKGVSDPNALISLLSNEKLKESENEILVFKNGNYTKNNYNSTTKKYSITESGTYIGNDSLTEISTDSGEYFYASLTSNRIDDSLYSFQGYYISSGDTLYVFEDVISSENPNLILFTITYAYTLTTVNVNSIPDSELNF